MVQKSHHSSSVSQPLNVGNGLNRFFLSNKYNTITHNHGKISEVTLDVLLYVFLSVRLFVPKMFVPIFEMSQSLLIKTISNSFRSI